MAKLLYVPFSRIRTVPISLLHLVSAYRETPFTLQDARSEWRGNGGIVFGMHQDECVGMMRLDAKRTYWTLSSFIISPVWRGNGLGKAWLTQLDSIKNPIYLQVKQDNQSAYGLYTSQGFETETISNGRYIMYKKEMH